MNVYEKLNVIQSTLLVPKNQWNAFGGYNFRNLEDILNAIKPLLKEHNCILTLSDDLELLGNRFYIKATATFTDCENGANIKASSLAREEEIKKKYDCSQLTGSASSYARKYALNGLFAIDDNKDADTTNKGEGIDNNKETPTTTPKTTTTTRKYYCGKCKNEISKEQASISLDKKGTRLCVNCMKDHTLEIKKILDDNKLSTFFVGCLNYLKKQKTGNTQNANESYFDYGVITGKWEALILKFVKSELTKIDKDFASKFADKGLKENCEALLIQI